MVDINELFADRNFQSLLAGMGSKFGRGGAGEAIGVPTQQYLQSQAAQEATAAQGKKQEEFWKNVIEALKGATPKDQPGLTSAKIAPGSVALDITPPSATAGAAGSGVTPAPTDKKEYDFSSIIPF